MTGTILLARPYPFLVEEMKPFLEEDGYQVDKVSPEGDELDAAGYAGAVIALASVSEFKLDPAEVLARLRRSNPELPVIFAGLLPLDSYTTTLARVAADAGIEPRLFGVTPESETVPELGQARGFFYIQRADLNEPEQRGRAQTLVRQHFH